jgi:hypothetical protein
MRIFYCGVSQNLIACVVGEGMAGVRLSPLDQLKSIPFRLGSSSSTRLDGGCGRSAADSASIWTSAIWDGQPDDLGRTRCHLGSMIDGASFSFVLTIIDLARAQSTSNML